MPIAEAMQFSQSGTMARGLSRFLKRHALVNPSYVNVPMRRSKHDPTVVMEQVAVMRPMDMALMLHRHKPGLLFCEPAKQVFYMQRWAHCLLSSFMP